jgi:hypothetical protein
MMYMIVMYEKSAFLCISFVNKTITISMIILGRYTTAVLIKVRDIGLITICIFIRTLILNQTCTSGYLKKEQYRQLYLNTCVL